MDETVVTIQLTQGQVTVVDDVDADADLAALSWYAWRTKRGKTFYVMRHVTKSDGRRTTEYLHQRIAERMGIIGPPDHIDRNGLNNRRDNLRPDPNGRSNANQGVRTDNTSGFKGVSLHRASGQWRAFICSKGIHRHLGLFEDPIEAAKVRDRAALAAFGSFAVLNFPTQ